MTRTVISKKNKKNNCFCEISKNVSTVHDFPLKFQNLLFLTEIEYKELLKLLA